MDWLDVLAVQGTLKGLFFNTTVQKHEFVGPHFSLESNSLIMISHHDNITSWLTSYHDNTKTTQIRDESYNVHVQSCPTPWNHRFLCQWHFPGKDTGVDYHFFLQWIFLTPGSNPCLLWLLHWQNDSIPLVHLGSLKVSTDMLNGVIVTKGLLRSLSMKQS